MKQHALVLLLLCSALAWGAACSAPSGQDAAPPLAIGAGQQDRLIEGPQARSMVDAMHPTPVAPVSSWVGYYGVGKGITIYASKFNDPAQAQSSIEAMKTTMGQDKSGFTPPESQMVARQAGFHTTGVNKEHFFYTRGSWLIWIEGQSGDFEPTVKSIRWVRASKEQP